MPKCTKKKQVEPAKEDALSGDGPEGVHGEVAEDDDEVHEEEVLVDEDSIVGVSVADVLDEEGEGGDVGDDGEDEDDEEEDAGGAVQRLPLGLKETFNYQPQP